MKILRSKYRGEDNIGTNIGGGGCEEVVCIHLFRDKFSLDIL
jgi:hypothetical protein